MLSAPLAIALHGGSGTILRETLTEAAERAYHEALVAAREAGWGILAAGGSALDAVQASAVLLEDCPLFNAGRGAVFTADGRHELDAAIMCGRTRAAGAVAAVRTVRNPVTLARKLLEDPRFVLLVGDGAEAYADQFGDVARVAPDWFTTPQRLQQLERAREQDRVCLDHDTPDQQKFGTIGVVALDCRGDLAAATSTGGLTNKRFGRVGDTPLIGSGTYADNRSCAVSCTGYGEEFIRAVVAHDVASRIEYLQEDLERACRSVIHGRLSAIAGKGGLIAVDRSGAVALEFNTSGMYRAWRNSSGCHGIAIFNDAKIAIAG